MPIVIDGKGQWGILPKPSDFVSTWKTNNTSAGSSTATQIKLPLVSTGTYNFVVDWGDGTTSTITTWNAAATTHTYATAGTYTVKIKGICTGWRFNNTGDRLKMLSVSSWGKLKLGNDNGYFYGCTNLNLSGVTDVLDLAGTTNLESCFWGCTSLTTIGRLNEWNVSSVTSMSLMFRGTTLFNQNIGSWNTQAVVNMQGIFRDAPAFNNGLASGIAGTLAWNTGAVTNMADMFTSATSFNCNVGSWNVSNVATFNSMFNTASKFNNGGSSDINNWVLKTTGTVTIGGMFQNTPLFNQPLDNWNTVAVTNMSTMFYGAIAFNNGLASGVAGTLAWNTANVTTMWWIFNNARSFNCNIGSWNVSLVADFSGMFSGAIKFNNGESNTINNWVFKTTGTILMVDMFRSAVLFNQPLNSWNTQAVTSMANMFNNANAFNNGLTSGTAGTLAWNTSAVTTMASIFQSAASFNCNVGSWNVGNVTNFEYMFYIASKFNNGGSSDINNWTIKTTGTVNMYGMFQQATIFNQNIGSWNTIAVTNMGFMFYSATAFNQNIGSWNVSAVTSFVIMFRNATNFNNGGSDTIGNWVLKTTGTVNINEMFYLATNFNQPLNGWNTVAVTSMSNVFFGATNFNNGLASGVAGTLSWNTSAVTTMLGMFQNATSFNCNIGSWNVSLVSDFSVMFNIASKFNNGGSSTIGNWTLKTTGTINATNMFNNAAMFNQSLSGWNTVAINTMQNMFKDCSVFNQDISSWNTSNVTNMGNMFSGSLVFNQNIGSWNTANVTDMSNMFLTAHAFNQNIGSWNVSKVTNFSGFMTNKTPATFSTTNLDAIYNGWSTRPVLASKSITFGTAKRTAASTAGRTILTNSPNLWTITDGGI